MRRTSGSEAVAFIADLVCCMDYLHSKRVVHRDLKPENIFIRSDVQRQGRPVLVVGDLGMARVCPSVLCVRVSVCVCVGVAWVGGWVGEWVGGWVGR